MSDTIEQLRTFITTTFLSGEGVSTLRDEDDLLAIGILDSYALVELVDYLRTDLDIDVGPEDIKLHNFRSLRAIAAFLRTKGRA
jgi:acyl carrier protein